MNKILKNLGINEISMGSCLEVRIGLIMVQVTI